MNKIPLTLICEGGWEDRVLHIVAPPNVNGTSFKEMADNKIPFYFDPRTSDWVTESKLGISLVKSITKGHVETMYFLGDRTRALISY